MRNKQFFYNMRLAELLRNHLRVPLFFNGYALVFNAAITSLIGIAYWWLAARLYPIETVGRSSATIAALMLLGGLSSLNMDSVLVRFVPRAGSARGRLIAGIYMIGILLGALISLIFLSGIRIWSPELEFLRSNWALFIAIIGGVVTSCLLILQDGTLTGMRQAKWVAIKNTVNAVLKLGLLVFLAFVLPQSGIIFSWIAPMIILIPIVSFLIFRNLTHTRLQIPEIQPEKLDRNQIIKSVSSNYLGFLFYQAYMMLPPILVLGQKGAEASAYFYLPWVIYSSLRLLSVNMSTSLVVEGSLERTKLREYSLQTLMKTAQLLIPAVFILFIAASLILSIFGNDYAREGTALLRWLVISTLPHTLVAVYLSILWLQNQFQRIAVVQGSFALLSLGFSLFLIQSYGITGVGIAWTISQTILALIILLGKSEEVIRLWRSFVNREGVEHLAD